VIEGVTTVNIEHLMFVPGYEMNINVCKLVCFSSSFFLQKKTTKRKEKSTMKNVPKDIEKKTVLTEDKVCVSNFFKEKHLIDNKNCSLDVVNKCDIDKTVILSEVCVAPIAGEESSTVKGDNLTEEFLNEDLTLNDSEKQVEYVATATAQIEIRE